MQSRRLPTWLVIGSVAAAGVIFLFVVVSLSFGGSFSPEALRTVSVRVFGGPDAPGDLSPGDVLTLTLPALTDDPASSTPQPSPTPAQEGDPQASASPTVVPTVADSFVTSTPVFDLWSTIIVYVCYADGSDEICTMRADGSDRRQLTDAEGTDWYPSLSDDGRSIVFSSQRDGQFEIYIMDSDGQNPRRLTRNRGQNYAPDLSPDGTRIIFASAEGPGSDQNIWIMSSDGTNLAQLTDHPANDIDPTWSPDGTRIVFASNRNGSTDLYIMDADGTDVRQVTDGMFIGGRNDWSPDGQLLTFYAGPPSDKNIYIASISCISLPRGCPPDMITQLTDGGNNKGPSFSPDGQWITFASNLNGENEVYIIRVDGSEMRQLTSNTYADWQPRWRP
jgi:Tol biopolymer transport system component